MENPKTLYLIDDDNDDLDFFCEAVNAIDPNFICIRATDSEAALRSFQFHDVPLPDMIFLDLNMPMVDGRLFLTELKKIPPYVHIPVVIYTTSSHPRDIEETHKLGAAAFISKPFSLDELMVSLHEVFATFLDGVSISSITGNIRLI